MTGQELLIATVGNYNTLVTLQKFFKDVNIPGTEISQHVWLANINQHRFFMLLTTIYLSRLKTSKIH